MPKKTIGLITVFLLIAAGVAQAQVSITYSFRGKQHFTMAIPDDWQINVGSEQDLSQTSEEEKNITRLISAMPNDGVPLWFGMWVPEDLLKITDAKEYMDSLGLDLLDDVIITEHKVETLNSMEVSYVSGTGKKEDEAMDFHAAFVQLVPESVAIAIYIGPHETTKIHGKALLGMIHSLQPVIQ
jgi:hypothetical protein